MTRYCFPFKIKTLFLRNFNLPEIVFNFFRKPEPLELIEAVFKLVEKRNFNKYREIETLLKKGIISFAPKVQSKHSMKKSLQIAERLISLMHIDSSGFWICNSIFRLFIFELFDGKKTLFK